MAKSNKDNNSLTRETQKANNKIRRDWGDISPVTKVIEDKRKKKPKYATSQYKDNLY